MTPRTFNTPLEAGLRLLFVLAAGRAAVDTQRLVYYDYLLVHSGQVNGPASLHARAPTQTSEVLVRRELVQDGLRLMQSRELVEHLFRPSGIVFSATKAGRHVAEQFDSQYAAMLRARATWVVSEHAALSDKQLARMLQPQVRLGDDELIQDRQPHVGETGRV